MIVCIRDEHLLQVEVEEEEEQEERAKVKRMLFTVFLRSSGERERREEEMDCLTMNMQASVIITDGGKRGNPVCSSDVA